MKQVMKLAMVDDWNWSDEVVSDKLRVTVIPMPMLKADVMPIPRREWRIRPSSLPSSFLLRHSIHPLESCLGFNVLQKASKCSFEALMTTYIIP